MFEERERDRATPLWHSQWIKFGGVVFHLKNKNNKKLKKKVNKVGHKKDKVMIWDIIGMMKRALQKVLDIDC